MPRKFGQKAEKISLNGQKMITKNIKFSRKTSLKKGFFVACFKTEKMEIMMKKQSILKKKTLSLNKTSSPKCEGAKFAGSS